MEICQIWQRCHIAKSIAEILADGKHLAYVNILVDGKLLANGKHLIDTKHLGSIKMFLNLTYLTYLPIDKQLETLICSG